MPIGKAAHATPSCRAFPDKLYGDEEGSLKYAFPTRYYELLNRLRLPFDPFGDLDEEQLLTLLDTLADEIAYEGINEAGDGVNEVGQLCVDLLTWLAKEDEGTD